MTKRALKDLIELNNELIQREDKKNNYIIELRKNEKQLTSREAKELLKLTIEKEIGKIEEIKKIKGEIVDIINRMIKEEEAKKWK